MRQCSICPNSRAQCSVCHQEIRNTTSLKSARARVRAPWLLLRGSRWNEYLRPFYVFWWFLFAPCLVRRKIPKADPTPVCDHLITASVFNASYATGCNHCSTENGRGVTWWWTEISTGLLTKPFCSWRISGRKSRRETIGSERFFFAGWLKIFLMSWIKPMSSNAVSFIQNKNF